MSHPIQSLLLEKESPLLGIHWGGELFVDAPLGDELPGAELTLRRAKLKFHRELGSDWQVKLTANYNKGGNFELDDSYFVFTGWSTALIKLGLTTPPFSLESVSGSACRLRVMACMEDPPLSRKILGHVQRREALTSRFPRAPPDSQPALNLT